SSREHAALVPLYLGIKAVLVKSFARIHCANLANAGIIPLQFIKEEDYDLIDQMDELTFENLKKEIQNQETVKIYNKTKNYTLETNAILTDRQRAMIIAGGLLNYTKLNA
ncbi:MAG: aconitate hydratase, partial [Oscillospiraceae bacterium]